MRIHLLSVLLFLSATAFSQGQLNIYQSLNKIKSLPPRYTRSSIDISTVRTKKGTDTTYEKLIKFDTNAIVKLLPFLSDTNATSIPNSCSGGFVTYGQLAFCIMNDIEPVPLYLATKS